MFTGGCREAGKKALRWKRDSVEQEKLPLKALELKGKLRIMVDLS